MNRPSPVDEHRGSILANEDLAMAAGSYLFAEVSGILNRSLMKWGDKGELAVHDVLSISRGTLVAIVAPAIVVILGILEIMTTR